MVKINNRVPISKKSKLQKMKDEHIIPVSLIFGLCVFIIIFTYLQSNNLVTPTPQQIVLNQHVCKEDSLRNVIQQMQVDISTLENGWDSKERRYEDILFEYQYGLDHLKNYHPKAYKDFHRIIAHKERYSIDDERENNKRLSQYSFE
jgi:hypothetical protein